jgi:hypothetical protein
MPANMELIKRKFSNMVDKVENKKLTNFIGKKIHLDQAKSKVINQLRAKTVQIFDMQDQIIPIRVTKPALPNTEKIIEACIKKIEKKESSEPIPTKINPNMNFINKKQISGSTKSINLNPDQKNISMLPEKVT